MPFTIIGSYSVISTFIFVIKLVLSNVKKVNLKWLKYKIPFDVLSIQIWSDQMSPLKTSNHHWDLRLESLQKKRKKSTSFGLNELEDYIILKY